MRFNDEHLVDRTTLSKEEAQAFIAFLEEEHDRHCREQAAAQKASLGYDLLAQSALAQFWHSAMVRHREDAEGCVGIIAEVTRAHGL